MISSSGFSSLPIPLRVGKRFNSTAVGQQLIFVVPQTRLLSYERGKAQLAHEKSSKNWVLLSDFRSLPCTIWFFDSVSSAICFNCWRSNETLPACLRSFILLLYFPFHWIDDTAFLMMMIILEMFWFDFETILVFLISRNEIK